MQKDLAIIVLAAGMGSRYGSLKQLDGLGPHDEVLLEFGLYDAIKAGFNHVVFVIREELESDFRERFGTILENRVKVSYVHQKLDDIPAGVTVDVKREKPWGTAHAMLAARNVVDSPFIIINADDYYGFQAYKIMGDKLRQGIGNSDALIAGYPIINTLSEHGTVSRGVCALNSDKTLQSIVERTKIGLNKGAVYFEEDGKQFDLTGKEEVSMNLIGFGKDFFAITMDYFKDFLAKNKDDLKSEFFLPLILNRLVEEKKGKVFVETTPETWFGVTYKEDRPVVVKRLQDLSDEGKYPQPLWQ